MKALFLCTEISGYFANCIQLFHDVVSAEVIVVHFPNVPEAPFHVAFKGIEQINKSKYSSVVLENKCLDFNPDLVYVGGWIDRDYLRICRKLKDRKIPVVSGLDNVWTGSLRQRMASLFSWRLIKPYFTHMWVAGQQQYKFARRLGYSNDTILTGLYAADIEKFESIRNVEPHTYLLYVGRFEPIKGVRLLYEVFNSLTHEQRNGWKLKMVGNGSLRSQVHSTDSIEVYDFMQPDKLISFAADAGAFILPSVQEPWGVVVQEFAAGGKPLILSTSVSSGEDYLIHGYNGLVFKNEDGQDLKSTLIHFFSISLEERKLMGKRSHTLALQGAPEYWVAKLASVKKTINDI